MLPSSKILYRHSLQAASVALVICGLAAFSARTHAQQLRVTNPIAIDRSEEIIEIDLDHLLQTLHVAPDQAKFLVATDAVTQDHIPVQLSSSTPGGPQNKLLLLVQLTAKDAETIEFKVDPKAPPEKVQVAGREAPERKDDFAWENRFVTFRIYGPALEKTGEITSGIDVWSKRANNFVIDSFYKREQQAEAEHKPELSYHKDDGKGLDSYEVGPSRGDGGTAVWTGGKLIASKNYTSLKILDNGPIRFRFQVTYAPWTANGVMVTETKTITLDAGSHLNQIVSTYTYKGAPLTLAAGIAIHPGGDSNIPAENGIASVWDTPQDPTAGHIATGLLATKSENAKTLIAAQHALLLFDRKSGEPFTYYAGSGWSKADMTDQTIWNAYLTSFLDSREHPLVVDWIAK
jgi:hypothetical protein